MRAAHLSFPYSDEPPHQPNTKHQAGKTSRQKDDGEGENQQSDYGFAGENATLDTIT